MPTYQYACTECGERLEAVQSFSDPALTECPVCQGRLRKVFNSVGVVFKGSGFYRNDSRKPAESSSSSSSSNGSTSSNGSSGDTKKSDSTTTTKSESKSESKPESKPAAAAAS